VSAGMRVRCANPGDSSTQHQRYHLLSAATLSNGDNRNFVHMKVGRCGGILCIRGSRKPFAMAGSSAMRDTHLEGANKLLQSISYESARIVREEAIIMERLSTRFPQRIVLFAERPEVATR